jgi:hypothetical protein
MKNDARFLLLLAWLVLASAAGAQTNGKIDPALAKTIEVVDFSGEGTYEVFPREGGGWEFFGPNRQITVNGKQKIAGFGSAVFGTTSGTSRIAVSLCYRQDGGAITSIGDDNHLIADADAARRTFPVAASKTLPAGTYAVGYCVQNRGPKVLGNNDYVTGWIMVIN